MSVVTKESNPELYNALFPEDETKEILDNLKNYEHYKYRENGRRYKEIEGWEIDILLDYINNLQQENKEWSMIFDTFSKRPYAHKYLEEKKKELGNKKIIGLDSEMIYKDYYDCKSRIEKATELIKQIFKDENWYKNYEYNDLENALKEVAIILYGGSVK